MKHSQAIEDYLKQIYLLQEESNARVSGKDLAARLDVSQASVTAMLKRLQELKLVRYERYGKVELSDSGLRIALEVVRHHRLLEAYFAEVLGMPWDEVHEEAEVLEHHISERLEQLIAAQLGDPQFDPHGHPIPALDGTLPQRNARRLSQVGDGEVATIHAVRDDRPEMLRYLDEIGLVPEAAVTVHTRAPLNGPITIQVGAASHAIAHDVAEVIDVSAG